ncbi:hypothetical protein D9M72_572660 [compost metagenome]
MDEGPGQPQGQQNHRPQVEEQGGTLQQALPAVPECQAYSQALFEFWPSLVYEVIADVAGDFLGRCAACQFENGAGYGCFRAFAVLCQVFHHVPVEVASGEFHGAVHSSRVFVQCLFDVAHGLDEIAPVGG